MKKFNQVIQRGEVLNLSQSSEVWVPGKDFDVHIIERGIYKKTKIFAKLEFLIEIIQESMQFENISNEEYGRLSAILETFVQRNKLD